MREFLEQCDFPDRSTWHSLFLTSKLHLLHCYKLA